MQCACARTTSCAPLRRTVANAAPSGPMQSTQRSAPSRACFSACGAPLSRHDLLVHSAEACLAVQRRFRARRVAGIVAAAQRHTVRPAPRRACLPSSSLWMRRSLLVSTARLAHTVAPRACSRGCTCGRSLGLWEQCASMHALQERRLARSFRTLCSAAVLGCVLRFNCCTACCTLHISSDFTSLHFAGR
jgi:hypothetical protein